MERKYLVLGATGSIGFAFTKQLLEQGIRATILVRNRQKAERLFNNDPLLEIIVGDVTDPTKLNEVSSDKHVIFHGINYPYHKWEEFMKPVTRNVIGAARQNNATILFPGNIYSFGNVSEKITEASIPTPTTEKGKLRLELLQTLETATQQGNCKVIVVRLPDFFGPNVTNGLIKPIFGNAAKKKPIEWLINADVPHQFVYTPDAAKVFFRLMNEAELPDYFLINYAGTVVPSIRDLGKTIGQITGGPEKVKVNSKFILGILSWFIPVIKELKENYYQFENAVLLDDSKLKKRFSNLRPTKMETAISETVEWFGKAEG